MHAISSLFVFSFNTFSHSYAVWITLLKHGSSGGLEEWRRVCNDVPNCVWLLMYFMLVLDHGMVLTKVHCDVFFITDVLSLNIDHTMGGGGGAIADICFFRLSLTPSPVSSARLLM